ncbi:hypothetical protein [Pseudomonas brassicacearum]|uniref:hypothetical protein n=1 Tax=Pseudomonas brassicacearum TaxID=930166 RepID=UPI0012971159|nr:hypothetical protein [Pseudomonas brassicacearum]QGA49978.1 hypothetical protein GFU70_12840 [Pseudomonas brassicacearum]
MRRRIRDYSGLRTGPEAIALCMEKTAFSCILHELFGAGEAKRLIQINPQGRQYRHASCGMMQEFA